jgi:hypothetical protein
MELVSLGVQPRQHYPQVNFRNLMVSTREQPEILTKVLNTSSKKIYWDKDGTESVEAVLANVELPNQDSLD